MRLETILVSRQRQQQADELALAVDDNNSLLVQALHTVDRRQFVPRNARDLAYKDEIVDLGNGSSVSQPSLVARMVDLLGLTGQERVLDIGTASGYTAALLAHCCERVYSVEYNPTLANRARDRLRRLGYNNVEVTTGDGALGWEERAPYNAILVSAAAKAVPYALFDQLTEGGRIVVPVGKDPVHCQLLVGIRYRKLLLSKFVTPVHFHPLMSSADGGWIAGDLDRLNFLKREFLHFSLLQAGISVESFRQQLARLAKLDIAEVDLDKYADQMELSEAELKEVEDKLKAKQVDSRQLAMFD